MRKTTLSTRLVRQGWVAPAAMALLIAILFFDPLHDSIGQHMSESIAASWWSAIAIRVLPCIMGASLVLFGFGCMGRGRGWSWAGLSAILFGAAMISAGIVPMGSPWHGMYGLAVFSVLVPAFYVAEFPVSKAMRQVSLAASFLGLVYMWPLFIGLDPPEYRGLTQRLSTLVSFGWVGLAALSYTKAEASRAALIRPKGM